MAWHQVLPSQSQLVHGREYYPAQVKARDRAGPGHIDCASPLNNVVEYVLCLSMKRYIYIIGPYDGAQALKIGIASDLEQRLAGIQVGSHLQLAIHGAFPIEGTAADARRVEQIAHSLLHDYHIRGEWFMCNTAEAQAAVTEAVRRFAGGNVVAATMRAHPLARVAS
jgi:hypothetical protein